MDKKEKKVGRSRWFGFGSIFITIKEQVLFYLTCTHKNVNETNVFKHLPVFSFTGVYLISKILFKLSALSSNKSTILFWSAPGVSRKQGIPEIKPFATNGWYPFAGRWNFGQKLEDGYFISYIWTKVLNNYFTRLKTFQWFNLSV